MGLLGDTQNWTQAHLRAVRRRTNEISDKYRHRSVSFFYRDVGRGGDAVEGTVSTFRSWFGVPEKCVRISPIPDGSYDKDDIKDEQDFCEIDFYSHDIALCPKIWSTSVGVVMYDISSGQFEGERRRFQETICAAGLFAKYIAEDKLGKLKFTMNRSGTSGAFSTSSLLYYHFSRYFDMSTKVPVAVWRNIDSKVLLGEIALGGVALTENNANLTRINRGWHTLVDTINDPLSYVRSDTYGGPQDLMATDGSTVFGALLDGSGQTYGPELDRSIDTPWSVETYEELQMIPTFRALASDAPLDVAISLGRSQALGNFSEMQDHVEHLSPEQLAFSMHDLSEVLLIDYIMSQQDRLGNIEYKPYFYWLDNGHVMRVEAKGHSAGEGKVPEDAVRILRMRLNDNDMGGREEYTNRTKLFGILEKLRHFDAKTYRRLMKLDADFQSAGPVYTWLSESLGLSGRPIDTCYTCLVGSPEIRLTQVQMIVDNTARAAEILRSACEDGTLRFDLEPKQFFENGYVTADTQSCTNNDRLLLTVGPLKIYSTVDDWVAHSLLRISTYTQWLEQVVDRQSIIMSD